MNKFVKFMFSFDLLKIKYRRVHRNYKVLQNDIIDCLRITNATYNFTRTCGFSGRLHWGTATNRADNSTSACSARWCHRIAASFNKMGGKFPAARRRSTDASSSSAGNLCYRSNLHFVILRTAVLH